MQEVVGAIQRIDDHRGIAGPGRRHAAFLAEKGQAGMSALEAVDDDPLRRTVIVRHEVGGPLGFEVDGTGSW